jgi:hypothetical protein
MSARLALTRYRRLCPASPHVVEASARQPPPSQYRRPPTCQAVRISARSALPQYRCLLGQPSLSTRVHPVAPHVVQVTARLAPTRYRHPLRRHSAARLCPDHAHAVQTYAQSATHAVRVCSLPLQAPARPSISSACSAWPALAQYGPRTGSRSCSTGDARPALTRYGRRAHAVQAAVRLAIAQYRCLLGECLRGAGVCLAHVVDASARPAVLQ